MRFLVPLVGASLLGGVLAAAGEYALACASGGARLWGAPRFYYQILLGVEAAWLGVLAAAVFGAGGAVYFLLNKKRRELELAVPALWVLAVAACGVPAARVLAVADFKFPWVRLGLGPVVAVAFSVGVVALWGLAAAVLYKVLAAVRRRFRSMPAKAALVVISAALLVPFVAADVYYLIAGRRSDAHRPDIYIVVMDAFRADRLSFYGGAGDLAPRLETFGREGVVFREAYTTSSWTKPSVASLFTSAYPSTHGVTSRLAALAAEAATLAEAMREMGYTTVGVSANPHVSGAGGMDDGFDVLDTTPAGGMIEAGGPPLAATRLFTGARWAPSFLGALWHPTTDGLLVNRRLAFWLGITDGPRFVYVHYMEPHTPYRPREEDKAALEPCYEQAREDKIKEIVHGRFFGARLTEDPYFKPDYTPGDIALAKALYDSDVRRMDDVITNLLDEILPAYSGGEAVVVITADHGEEFLEHGRWLHAAGLHHEIARVPMMIGGAGCGDVRGAVNLVDVAPTVVSLAGGAPAGAWEGTDLTPYLDGAGVVPPRDLLLEGIIEYPPVSADAAWASIELAATLEDGYYYLYDYNAGREYLYDEGRDRKQLFNLAGGEAATAHADLLTHRREDLASLRKAARARALTPRYVQLPSSMENQLRAMGYVN